MTAVEVAASSVGFSDDPLETTMNINQPLECDIEGRVVRRGAD